jgi:hypothetical protein
VTSGISLGVGDDLVGRALRGGGIAGLDRHRIGARVHDVAVPQRAHRRVQLWRGRHSAPIVNRSMCKPVAQGFRSSRRGIDAAGASFAGKETGGRWVEKVQECAFSPFC